MSARATSWPAPVAFEESTAVRQLVALTRDPDAGIVAIRLWQHRRRCGATIPGPDADATLETIAGNGRRRRGVALHLRAAGFVEEGPNGSLVVRAWEDVAFVDWTRAGGESRPKASSAQPKPESVKRAERRRRRATGGQAPDTCADSTTDTDVSAPDKTDSPPRVRLVSAPDSQPDPRARTCATVTVTGTVTGTKSEEPSAPAAVAPGAGPAVGHQAPSVSDDRATSAPPPVVAPTAVVPPLKLTPDEAAVEKRSARQKAKADRSAGTKADCDAWLARYGELTGTPPADLAALDSGPLRIRYAKARGSASRDAATLIRAMEGALARGDGFWRGKGPIALLGEAAIGDGLTAGARGASPSSSPNGPQSRQVNAAWADRREAILADLPPIDESLFETKPTEAA
jgi:hypothetical protein